MKALRLAHFLMVLTVLSAIPVRSAEDAVHRRAIDAARRVDSALGIGKGDAALIAPDAEFLRRVYLDVAGRPPTLGEAKAFLDSRSADKRTDLIGTLLDSGEYTDLAARRWSEVLFGDYRRIRVRGGGKTLTPLAAGQAFGRFREWFAAHLSGETPWPEIVAELVRAEGKLSERPSLLYKASFFGGGPAHLNVADGMSRHLLGIRISCARCHDHPFDRWTQEDYYGFAAYAARTTSSPAGISVGANNVTDIAFAEADKGDLVMPGTKKMMPPRFLTGGRTAADDNRMQSLSRILSQTTAGREQIVRNVVNRAWAYYLGRGFVTPIDDFNRKNRPIAPAAFDALVSAFTKNGHSLKFLTRAILLTKAYQRSSEGGGDKPFAAQAVRQLTAEQLFKSLVVGGFAPAKVPDFRAVPVPKFFADFLKQVRPLHGAGSTWTEVTPLPGNPRQSLLVRNGKLAHGIVTHPMGVMRKLGDLHTDPDRLELVFLAILSRRPTYRELVRYSMYLEQRKVHIGVWQDVTWALMNSAEFLTRH